ncbi:MAG: sugar ABC transporter permease [Oscillospiraceae bacterium]|nr:sugar ABC transporter permease [Oscillospiraceae bacterium]
MDDALSRSKGKNAVLRFLGFFQGLAADFVNGDIFVKLSLIVMGAGYFRRRQIAKGVLATLFQAVMLFFTFSFAAPTLSKFTTLGTVKFASVFNPNTMKNEINDYDHSFYILLFGIVSLIVLACALVVYLRNIRNVRALEVKARQGKRIPAFIDEIKSFRNERFHITLLSLPCLGVVMFTIVPLLVLIAVAFTNYDQQTLPPAELFTWVGFNNFRTLLSNTTTSAFGYAFSKVLSWTLIWAFTATFSCYICGILLSLFINNARTKFKQLWRTMFVVSIAVPQFVTLLVVRNFFATTGIVNTICAQLGITEFLKNAGLVSMSLDYIPFLTNPSWAKVMIILINIWIGVPYLMLIATGILMNIPKELYESARIDGASSFKTFVHITMPYMLFVTAPYLITSVVANINNFNVIYLLTQDIYRTTDQTLANVNATEIDLLVTWLFRLTQQYYNYKMASVIGIMVFIVCAVFTLLAFNVVLRRNKEDKFQL